MESTDVITNDDAAAVAPANTEEEENAGAMITAPTSPSSTTTADNNAAAEGVPDEAVVSLADAVSHALDQPQATTAEPVYVPPPAPLPAGWILKESRSQPNYYYYYHQDTGISTWHNPAIEQPQQPSETSTADLLAGLSKVMESVAAQDAAGAAAANNDNIADSNNSKKRSSTDDNQTKSLEPALKKPKSSLKASSHTSNTATSSSPHHSSRSSSSKHHKKKPKQVRIFHILKKHKGSRRPSSWRQKTITISKEEAIAELEGLLELLKEENPGADQRATFEELARTESDCTSAKRGGDLGYFGKGKMQAKFEEASFAMEIGELSGIVETSSGVHVLLRIG